MLNISSEYIYQSVIQAPIYHLLLEGILFMWVIWLLKRKKINPSEIQKLTPKEEQEILDHYQPKPLVYKKDDENDESDSSETDWGTVEGPAGKYIEIDGQKYLNLATFNYLGFVEEPSILAETERCIRQYGVGSCGPRGFYGTVDVHLELEEAIAKFLNLEETALYAYAFAAISSAIPSYAKRGDVIFADEHVNFAIQRGLVASRSDIRFFKHNDVEDLKRLLKIQKADDLKNPVKAKTVRRFCVVEGIYSKTGLMCPLKEVAEICLEYKVRLFVDESISFGAVGDTGRGVTEHLQVPLENIDFISGSLEQGLGAFGGFIVGSSYVVDHQRISGLGYCFSASLPPMLAGAGMQALKLIDQNPNLVRELQQNCEYMHRKLAGLPQFVVSGHFLSPVKHVSLQQSFGSRRIDKYLLKEIVFHVREKARIALVMPAYLEKEEKTLLPPSIRISVNRLLTEEEMDSVISALESAAGEVLSHSNVLALKNEKLSADDDDDLTSDHKKLSSDDMQ